MLGSAGLRRHCRRVRQILRMSGLVGILTHVPLKINRSESASPVCLRCIDTLPGLVASADGRVVRFISSVCSKLTKPT